jgi:hypothetical protein
MTMDTLTALFPFDSPSFMRLHRLISFQILEEAAEQGISLVVTTGWRFDQPTDSAFNLAIAEPFSNRGGRVHYVELFAPIEIRLERNKTENRRRHKKTDWATDGYLRELDARHRYDSGGQLPFGTPFLRLDTTDVSASDAAELICGHFALPRISAAR